MSNGIVNEESSVGEVAFTETTTTENNQITVVHHQQQQQQQPTAAAASLHTSRRVIIHNPYQTTTSKKRARSDEQAPNVRTTGACSQTTPDAISTVNPVVKKTPTTATTTTTNTSSTTTSSTTVSDQVSALVIAAADKAGMQGIDRARIDAIILRESAQTLYMQQQQRRDEKVNARIAQMKAKALNNTNTTNNNNKICTQLQQEEQDMIRRRPVRSTCVVVDMDMFYMACELLTRPDLRQRPACVGGNMILTSNYAARKYGVRSAMAGWIGDALVRELSNGQQTLIHVQPPNFALYQTKSKIVQQVLQEYDPFSMRAYSLDEVYLDVKPYLVQKLLHPDWSHEQIRDYLLLLMRHGSGSGKQQSQKDKKYASTDTDTTTTTTPSVKARTVNTSKTNPNNVSEDRMQLIPGNDDSIDNSSSSSSFYQEPTSPAHEDNYDTILVGYSPELCLEQASRILSDMRQRIFDQTGGLTCSAGLAPTFKLAKIASDHNKPDGQCLVASDHESVLRFLHPLPTRKVPGIGRVTEKILKAFGIETVRQLYEQRVLVQQIFTPIQAKSLWLASIGCSSSDGKDDEEEEEENNNDEGITQKGISRERTFRPGKSWTSIMSKLEDIARILSNDMQQKNLLARTITVKVKLHTFDALSKARSLDRPTLQSPDDLLSHAAQLLTEIRSEFLLRNKKKKDGSAPSLVFSVRLLGIRCSNFQNETSSTDHEANGNQMHIESFLKDEQDQRNQKKKPNSPPPPRKLSSPEKYQMQMDLFLQLPREQSDACASRRGNTSSSSAGRAPKETTKPEAKKISLCTDSAPTPETDTVSCPICGKDFPQNANAALNHHIDSCLSGNVVREVVQEETKEQQMVSNGRKRRLTDFFSVSS